MNTNLAQKTILEKRIRISWDILTDERKAEIEQKLSEVRAKYGINRKHFNKSDFFRICENERILTLDRVIGEDKAKLRQIADRGLFGILGTIPTENEATYFVWLRCFEHKNFRSFVAFHELGHFFLGHTGLLMSELSEYRKSRASLQKEAEADYFAFLASGNHGGFAVK